LDTWPNIKAPSSSQKDPPLRLEYTTILIELKRPLFLIENGFIEEESKDDEVRYPTLNRSNKIIKDLTSALMMLELLINVLRELKRSLIPSLSS